MNELTIRVLCDVRAETTVDGAVLFSQTQDNQNSVFLIAGNLTPPRSQRYFVTS